MGTGKAGLGGRNAKFLGSRRGRRPETPERVSRKTSEELCGEEGFSGRGHLFASFPPSRQWRNQHSFCLVVDPRVHGAGRGPCKISERARLEGVFGPSDVAPPGSCHATTPERASGNRMERGPVLSVGLAKRTDRHSSGRCRDAPAPAPGISPQPGPDGRRKLSREEPSD